MHEEQVNTKIELADLIPGEWVDKDGKYHLMQSVYQCLFFTPEQHDLPYITGRMDDVFYFIMNLTEGLQYKTFNLEFTSVGSETHATENVFNTTTPPGPHILFFTPYKEGGSISEVEALSKFDVVRGLLNAVEGKNATYLHRFNQVITFPEGTTTEVSHVMLNPASFPHPFQNLTRAPEVQSQISALGEETKNRIYLALRWFDKSDREVDPIDAFLKIWFALEVLGMPNTTNIRPIVEALAVIYEMTYDQAVNHFRIGVIQNFRSEIVHHGHTKIVHQQLFNYIQAIFVDILFYQISRPSELRTASVLSDTTFAERNWRP